MSLDTFPSRSVAIAQYGDTANIDAFSRLRVSQPVGLFDVQCQYNDQPLVMETGATGTGVAGAHDANTRMVALAKTNGTGTSFLQSYEYIPYQAGKSQLVFITGLLGAAVASELADVGLFDAANGIFLRQNGTTNLQIIRRTSTSGSIVDNAVAQTSWNIDKLDGTGVSGKTLDVTKVFILVIDAQFLGMGRVRIGFDIDGVICWAHQFLNANVLAVPYMQSLTLPVQMLVSGSGAGKTSYFKCASVSSEGGSENVSAFSFATAEQTVTAGSATATHLLSVRPKTTFNGIANRTRFQLESIEILVTGAQQVLWQLCVGSTFSAAPTYGDINTTYSAFEQSTAVGTLSAVGTVIAAGYIASSASAKEAVSKIIASRYPITLDRAGAVRAMGTLSLIVTGIGGASATRALFNFTELR